MSGGVETVAIAGYMTHMCVDTTSRQAAHRGYAVEILSDATGTLPLENSGGAAAGEELHRATLVAQGQFFADIVTTDAWLDRLAGEVVRPIHRSERTWSSRLVIGL